MSTIVYNREILRTVILMTKLSQLQMEGSLPLFRWNFVVVGLEMESVLKELS